MKEKILTALKTKYKNLGLDENILLGLAAQFEATTTDETLDNVVNGVEPLLKSFQGHIDKRVTDATAKAKLEAIKAPKPEPQNPAPTNDPKDNDSPEWVKALLGKFDSLNGEIQTLKGNKVLTDRKQILEEKLKDAAPAFKGKILKDFARMNFETDEVFNEYLSETEADLTVFTQEIASQGVTNFPKPGIPTQQPANASVINEMKAWAEKDKAAKV